jgi:hypothetical protein
MGRVTIDPDLMAIAIHEAAHLTIASRLGLDVRKVEIRFENGVPNGYSSIIEASKLTDWLTVLLAGETAEVEVFGRQMLPRVHARSDREELYRCVVRAGRMGEQCLIMARQKVVKLVHIHRPAIIGLGYDLLARVDHAQGADVTVEGDDLVRMLGGPDVAILRLAELPMYQTSLPK